LTYEDGWVKRAVDLQGKPVTQPTGRRDFQRLTDYPLVSPGEQSNYSTYRSFDRYFIPWARASTTPLGTTIVLLTRGRLLLEGQESHRFPRSHRIHPGER
jgi:hypothetical protein